MALERRGARGGSRRSVKGGAGQDAPIKRSKPMKKHMFFRGSLRTSDALIRAKNHAVVCLRGTILVENGTIPETMSKHSFFGVFVNMSICLITGRA